MSSCPVCNKDTQVAAPVNLEICQIIGSFSNHYFPTWQVSPTSTTPVARKVDDNDDLTAKIIADAYRLIALHKATTKMKVEHSRNGVLILTESSSPRSTNSGQIGQPRRPKRKRRFGSIRCSKCNKFGIEGKCCEGAQYHVVVRVKR